MSKNLEIGSFHINIDETNVATFDSFGVEIDSDGAARAYNPRDTGLDFLQNAKDQNGNLVGVLTVHGKPVIQGPDDPAPGYYVSTTSYQNQQYEITNPLRYLDAESIPYIVVSPTFCKAVIPKVLGSQATLNYGDSFVDCIVGDIGPRNPKKIEISIAAAVALGIPSSPKNGGTDNKIHVTIYIGVPATINGVEYPLQSL